MYYASKNAAFKQRGDFMFFEFGDGWVVRDSDSGCSLPPLFDTKENAETFIRETLETKKEREKDIWDRWANITI